jgi:hypothetical protein
MCMFVSEVPTSARAGLVWPCWKWLIEKAGAHETPCWRARVSDDGWLFPTHRSGIADWYKGRETHGDVIYAFTNKEAGYDITCRAWAVGVLAFGQGDLIARAVFIPHVAEQQHPDPKFAARTSRALRRLSDGHGGQRELFELHPKLRYAVTGKR